MIIRFEPLWRWLSGSEPKAFPFEDAVMLSHEGSEIIILGDGRQYIGSSTVWRHYPSFRSVMSVSMGLRLASVWRREKYKRRNNGKLPTFTVN